MGEPLITPDIAQARAPVPIEGIALPALQDVILAASQHMEGMVGRALVEADFTKVYDGDRDPTGKYREVLYLPNPPIRTSAAPVITENGVALSVASAYDATGNALVYLESDTGRLTRWAGWLPGLRNISVSYHGAVGLPTADLIGVCVELTWLIWQNAAKRGGMISVGLDQASFQASRDLSDSSRQILDRYRLRQLV